MKSSKKLIQKEQLVYLTKLRLLGVPIKKLIKDNNLDMTSPTLVKLLDQFDEMMEPHQSKHLNQIKHDSMFPSWVNPDILGVQVQPKEWVYHGKFLKGEWRKRKSQG